VTAFEIVNQILSVSLIAGTAVASLLLWTDAAIGVGAVAALVRSPPPVRWRSA